MDRILLQAKKRLMTEVSEQWQGNVMNLKYLDMAVRQKICPVCSAGMTREISPRIYQCSRSRCNETFDFSQLSDSMLRELLEKKAEPKKSE